MLYGLQRRRSESNRRMEVLQTSALPLGYGAGRTGKLFPRVAVLKPQESRGSWTLAESPIWATIKAILRDRFGIPPSQSLAFKRRLDVAGKYPRGPAAAGIRAALSRPRARRLAPCHHGRSEAAALAPRHSRNSPGRTVDDRGALRVSRRPLCRKPQRRAHPGQ